MADWLVTAAGLGTVLFVLIDIFHTLANPGALGRLSRTMLHLAWRIPSRRLSGPLAMLAVVMIWGVIAVLGWAAVYWPHMSEGFTSVTPRDSGAGIDALDALYVSLVTISTLGLGDVFPTSGWLRLVNPMEALFGFALLTVAVSWILQVFPALIRRRELALRLTHLDAADTRKLFKLDETVVHSVLYGLADAVTRVRIDLHDYPETYYFREAELASSLPATLDRAQHLSSLALCDKNPTVQHGGALLDAALVDLAAVLDSGFLHRGGTTGEIIEAFRIDHDLHH
ncbi:MAG: potassium channel family protein [Aeromicrobium sp.]